MADVVMPRLSDSMEEGTILQWLKSVGDEVAVGEELVEIETDKANMAYESDAAGTLSEIVAEEGETLPIGAVIARVGDWLATPDGSAAGPVAEEGASSSQAAGDAPSSTPPADETAKKPAEAPIAAEAAPAAPAPEADGHRPKASPLASAWLRSAVSTWALSGSGPGGRIVKADVERAARPAGPVAEGAALGLASCRRGAALRTTRGSGRPVPETAKGQVEHAELSKLQQTVARRMAESKATAPHFYLQAEIDMSRAVEARARIKADAGEGEVVPSFNDMVVKACALALREHPRANGAYRDGRFELYSRVNVGVAVAARDALVVPTVFDADRKGLRQIAADSRALAERVRDGHDHPARALRGDLHGLQPGDVRDRQLRRGDQPAAGGDPRGRRDRRAPRRSRRRADDRPHDVGHPRLRPPHPLRRRRSRVPGPDPHPARGAALPRPLARV